MHSLHVPSPRVPCSASVNCFAFSVDGELMATGHSDSVVTVWSLTAEPLVTFRDAETMATIHVSGRRGMHLAAVFRPAILAPFMEPFCAAESKLSDFQDPESASKSKLLVGHAGPVFALSFSPDKLFLLSSSEDRTSRSASLGQEEC